jgi:hypothetical protein
MTLAALTSLLLTGTAAAGLADPVFNRISSFPVALNLPKDAEEKTESSAEIITAGEDGNTLIYSDSPLGAIGFIDIRDARAPAALGALKLDGEPTSVAAVGAKVLAAVNTSESKIAPAGKLAIVDIASRKVDSTCDLGGQPDSVAIAKDGSFAAIAIENERDEELNDGDLPQMPAGDLAIVRLANGTADCASIKHVSLTGLAEVAGDDPEPEFVAINDKGEIALTLQENNHIVIIDGQKGEVTGHFSAGSVELDGVDAKTDGKLDFSGKIEAMPREPDAVKWIDNDRIMVANEGDWKGGTRGFTIFEKSGKVLHDAGNSFETEVALIGHYPEKRAGKKGTEPEGLEVARFDGKTYGFVLAERASVVGVYDLSTETPRLTQLLPSGISPEGAVAIPGRNLLVTANELDLGEDDGARSHVMIYERAEGTPAYPTLRSTMKDGSPIGWGALSGLAAVPGKPGMLYAVSDSVYGMSPAIYTIDATRKPAEIVDVLPVKRNGQPAQKLDIEGIALDAEGMFWLASEGNSEKLVPHALYHVNVKGEIKEEIALPAELLAGETRFGFEGIAVTGTGADTTLWMAVQREWKDDPKGMTKLLSYKPESKEWAAVHYPLEKAGEGWVGLSEIAIRGDYAYVIERDNQVGGKASLKKLYRVALSELKGAPLGGELPVVKKEEAADFLPALKAGNGYVMDKIEGFAFDADGKAFAVTDNDGVDDSSGETWFFTVDLAGKS